MVEDAFLKDSGCSEDQKGTSRTLMGIKPVTLWLRGWRSTDWANLTLRIWIVRRSIRFTHRQITHVFPRTWFHIHINRERWDRFKLLEKKGSKCQVRWSGTPFWRIRAAEGPKRGAGAEKRNVRPSKFKKEAARPLFDETGLLSDQKGAQQLAKRTRLQANPGKTAARPLFERLRPFERQKGVQELENS